MKAMVYYSTPEKAFIPSAGKAPIPTAPAPTGIKEMVTQEIEKYLPNAEIHGNDKTPRNGAFEVTIDGKLVYSKFSTGNFPQAEDISSWF